MDISVVIPSYNHSRFIQATVSSVLTQSIRDLELIVVDDGSTDNSVEILKAIDDPRLQVITQHNEGAHSAINRGLSIASSDYLAIINSDDAYYPSRLETLIDVLELDSEVGLVASYIEVVDQNGIRLGVKHGYRDLEPWLLKHPGRSFRAGDDLHSALLTENYLSTTSNFVFRKSLYSQVGPFRPLIYAHDWDFALRTAQVSRLAMVAEPLLRYRVHESNTIREDIAAMIFEICWCLAVHLPNAQGDLKFKEANAAMRIDQLLNSIYTYNCDRVLNVMFLEGLSGDYQRALNLLDPTNSTRAKYIDFIVEQIRYENQTTTGSASRGKNWLSKLFRSFKRL